MDDTTKEVAKTIHKGLEVTEKIGGFLSTVLGDGCKELGGAFTDWAKFFRQINAFKILDLWAKIIEKRGLEGKTIPIPLSIGIPLLEAASLVEDETLQRKWAALIANATDPNYKEKIRKSYVDILSSLDADDALILDWAATNGSPNPLSEPISIQFI